MSLFADDNKQRVKEATDIVDLLGNYLPQLRRQGAMLVGHCPWHDDRKPSFQINPARQTWACWVCDIRGDVFDFVMRREGVDFRGALQILADRAGIELKQTGRRIEKGSPDDKQTLYQAMAWAEEQYHRCLLVDPAAAVVRRYLQDRNISEESIEKFRLGFSPLSNRWLEERARNSAWSPPIFEACGLLAGNDRGYGFYERFRGRLMFPIQDTLSRTIGFGGRIVPGVFPKDEEPPAKYVNSPETKLFSKSENLYGLNFAASSASRTRNLVVVEGYTDVIGSVQAGLEGVVACLGTAINQRHIRLMKRYADRITLVLDGDTAGQKRTSEVLDLFVAEAVDLRIMTLPPGLDPFDFVQENGADKLQEMIDAAPDALEHRIRIETTGVDLMRDSHQALQALERILETIAQAPQTATGTVASAGLRTDQLLSRLSRQFDVDREVIHRRLKELRQRRPRTHAEPNVKAEAKIDWSKLDHAERTLLELLLADSELLDLAIEQVAPELFSAGPMRRIYETICEGFHNSLDVSFEGLMLLVDVPELRNLLVRLDEVSAEKQAVATVSTRDQLQGVLQTIRSRAASVGQRKLLGQMDTQTLDEESELDLLQRMLNETRERFGIATPTDGSSARPFLPQEPADFDPAEFPPDQTS